MTLQEQIAQMRRVIEQWQKDPSGSAAMKRQLQALQSELDNLVKRTRPLTRGQRLRSARLMVVQPTPPPSVALTPSELGVFQSFSRYHARLLQYSGWVNRTEWLQMTDVAADLTSGHYYEEEPVGPGPGEWPTGSGTWVWNAALQLWTILPSGAGIYGWSGPLQRWVLIDEEDGGDQMGVTDGSNALPGRVGEILIAVREGDGSVPQAQIPLSSDATPTFVSIISLLLTPGDWDLQGAVGFGVDPALVTNPIFCAASYNLTVGPIAGLPGTPTNWGFYGEILTSSGGDYIEAAIPVNRVSITAPTTIYIVANCTPYNPVDLGKIVNGAAMIRARRMR